MGQPRKQRVVVAISGAGRSLQRLIDFAKDEHAAYTIIGVISSNPSALGNAIAPKNQLPIFIGKFDKSLDQIAFQSWLNQHQPDWIALAGFLKPFPLNHTFAPRTINIHPSLLPRHGGKGMYGHHVHEAVIKNRDQVTGATVHFATSEYDKGRIIAQVRIAVNTDDPKSLADAVFRAECDLYPKVLDQLARGALPLPGEEIYRYDFA